MDIKKKVRLAQYTTFKIGGKADYFYIAKSREDLRNILLWAKEQNIPFFILGGGSNLLVSDSGFRGLAVKIEFPRIFSIDFLSVVAEAGCKLSNLVDFALENSLSGAEWAAGIPGTVGGAIVGNAGAYGQSMADIVEKVEVFSLDDFSWKTLLKKECCFSYRNSQLKSKYIILSGEILLKKGNVLEIKSKMAEYLKQRLAKQPAGKFSAGCFFKNLEIKDLSLKTRNILEKKYNKKFEYGKVAAAWLIEQCGLKGKKIGDAQVSEKHANFIVNLGKAKGSDVLNLVNLIEREIMDKFEINIQKEVILL